jgi:hypothetical protein
MNDGNFCGTLAKRRGRIPSPEPLDPTASDEQLREVTGWPPLPEDTVQQEVTAYVEQLMEQEHATLVGRAWSLDEPTSRADLSRFLTKHFIRFMDFAEGQRA